jgi:hypothetical protein
LLGLLRAGPGRAAERDFNYALASVGATYTCRPGALYIHLGAQAFDIDRARGHLAQAGLTWVVRPHVTTAWTYTTSLGGGEQFDFVTARIDLLRGSANFLGGATRGETVPVLLGPSNSGGQLAIDYRQGFIGWQRPGARVGVDVILEYEEIGGTPRGALQTSLRVALPGAGPQSRP